jgi:hypothetical protein
LKISNKKISFFPSLNQYFPHIPYVASKKNKKIAGFHFLGPFMNKQHDFSDKKNSVCHVPLPPLLSLLDEICLDATEVALKAGS